MVFVLISEDITFNVGKLHIAGTLVKPDNPKPYPVVIFVHGSGPANREGSGLYLPLWKRFTRLGYACLSWDKPGVGESTGEYGKIHLFRERAKVVKDAICFLSKRSDIDVSLIGLWGISQAGWIMPMVAADSMDVRFIIAVSCAGESGIRQGAYLIRKQLELEGLSLEETSRYGELYIKRGHANTYEEYLQYAKPFSEQPYIQDELPEWGKILSPKDFTPFSPNHYQFLNPIPYVEKITCPVLAIWGEKDTQVDPKQGARAYQRALQKAGNKHFRIVVFPEADHVITRTKTGSLKEKKERKRLNKREEEILEYFDIMEDWLKKLQKENSS
jgi:pimeloyl-ACP methyl ester carboxylesterase